MSVGSLGLDPTPAAPNPTPLGVVRLFCSVVVLGRKQSTRGGSGERHGVVCLYYSLSVVQQTAGAAIL